MLYKLLFFYSILILEMDEEKIINNKVGNIEKKSYYRNFIQKLLFSITFFSLCLYLIMENLRSTNIPLVIMKTKIIFYYFYDMNAKVNYKISEKDRLYASTYFGDDVFKFSNTENTFKAKIPWGNRTATVRWNHLFSDKLFMNTTAVYNRYDFQFGGAQQTFNIKLTSGIRDWNLKSDIDGYKEKNAFRIQSLLNIIKDLV